MIVGFFCSKNPNFTGGNTNEEVVSYLSPIFSVLACGGLSPEQIAQQTATAATVTSAAATARIIAMTNTAAAWTKTPTQTSSPTATPDYNASLARFVADVYEGPSEKYHKMGFTINPVTIYGQAYSCAWFQVFADVDGSWEVGWIKAEDLTYSIDCTLVALAEIPSLPTSTPTLTPTNTPRPQPVNTLPPPPTAPPPCDLSSIEIENDTDGPVSLILSGPYSYTFYLGTGTTSIAVCPGTYNYVAYGCGSSASGTMSSGESHQFWCE